MRFSCLSAIRLVGAAGLLSLVAANAAGCSTVSTAEVASDSVVRGAPVPPGQYTNVLHLGRINDRGEVKYGCTVTLVTPKYALTAGHCIEHEDVRERCVRTPSRGGGRGGRPGIDDGVLTGLAESFDAANRFVVKHPTKMTGAIHAQVAVSKVWASSRFRDDSIGWGDAALLELSEPIEGATIVPMLTDFAETRAALREGKSATLVGFGRTALFDDVDGEKRVAHMGDVKIRRVSLAEADLGGGNTTDAAASPGDSGGPAFVTLPNGEKRVFGITSRGPSNFSSSDIPAVYGIMRYSLCDLQRVSGVSILPAAQLRCDASDAAGNAPATDLAELCANAAASADQKDTLLALRLRVAEEQNVAAAAVTCDMLATQAATWKSLDLSHHGLRDTTALTSLVGLESLNLDGNLLTSVAPLAALPALRTLRVGWNELTSINELDARERAGLVVLGKRAQRGNIKDTKFLELCRKSGRTDDETSAVDAVERILWNPAETPAGDTCDRANRELVTMRNVYLGNAKWSIVNRQSCDVEQTFPAKAVTALDVLSDLYALEGVDVSVDDDHPNRVLKVAPLATLPNLTALNIKGNPVDDAGTLDALVRGGLVIKR